MNALWKTFSRTVTGATSIASQFANSVFKRNDFRIQEFVQSIACKSSLYRMHRMGDYPSKAKRLNPLDGKPFAKGIVLKTLIRKPKKPNSANRKCVLVKLSTGKEMIAFVPGEGHNLQVKLITYTTKIMMFQK